MKKILWVTSPSSLPGFLAAEGDLKYAYTTGTDADLVGSMEECGWVVVGEAEVTATYHHTDEIRRLALQECEKAIEKVSAEFSEKINALKAFRSDLLCLEAPSNV